MASRTPWKIHYKIGESVTELIVPLTVKEANMVWKALQQHPEAHDARVTEAWVVPKEELLRVFQEELGISLGKRWYA